MLLILPRAAATATATAAIGILVVSAGQPGSLVNAPSVAGFAASGGDDPTIVATMSIWADVVDHVDCTDRFDVQTLIPAGGDPHSYEPSMRDRETLSGAALVVANGGELEAQLHDTLESVADEGTPVVEMFEHVTTRPLESEHREDEAAEHDHGGDDPHIWFDPQLVIEGLPSLGDALVAAGADEAETEECVATFTAELEELDVEVTALLSDVPAERRQLVTNHEGLGYFAARYGFDVLGSVIPSSSTLVEASPAELDELAATIEAEGVPAIFAEVLESTDDASALGDRLGVDVVMLYTDSLGDEGSGAESYVDLMRFDASAIAAALAGE